MIKNIIFDMSEVIISGYFGVEELIEKNTNMSAGEFLKRKQETIEIFFDLMRGKISEDEYINHLTKGADVSKEKIKELFRKNINIPVEGTMDIIKRLEGNYNLILLSDYPKEWKEFLLENNKEIEIFKIKYFSCDYGKIKSDGDFFKYVIKDLNISPEDSIFIDDLERNVETASKYGIKGIVFRNSKQLEEELKKVGLL
ncbi:MAG: HAD family phosphatase [Clostridia bacterium]|nr:HAD family phosphatase [Clostridia bacterium]